MRHSLVQLEGLDWEAGEEALRGSPVYNQFFRQQQNLFLLESMLEEVLHLLR